jgi:UDP-glucose 4-epimerase
MMIGNMPTRTEHDGRPSRLRYQAKPVQTGQRSRRGGDPARLVGDSSAAIVGLEWKPRYAGLEEMLMTVWKWHEGVATIVIGGSR